MNEKEKAKELVEKMQQRHLSFMAGSCKIDFEDAKQCALICVDEILNLDNFSIEGREYWQEVKTEIEKL